MVPLTRLDRNTTKQWEKVGYSFHPFSVEGTTRTFDYGKPTTREDTAVPSNLSALCTLHTSEVLINGVLQGRQQADPHGASRVSRRKIWEAVVDVVGLAGEAATHAGEEEVVGNLRDLASDVGEGSYADAKIRCAAREEVKRVVKEVALKKWRRNEGDEGWMLSDSA
jgi:tRNA-specific adenosine deaminase 1